MKLKKKKSWKKLSHLKKEYKVEEKYQSVSKEPVSNKIIRDCISRAIKDQLYVIDLLIKFILLKVLKKEKLYLNIKTVIADMEFPRQYY